MRVRCAACGAPYFLQPVLPPDGPRCPNCDAPAPVEPEPVVPRAAPATEARSRVVTAVAGLHFLMAAGGLCLAGGAAAVAGETGVRLGDLWAIAVAGAGALAWAGVGIGLLTRWAVAWHLSLVLCGFALLYGLAVAVRSPCGGVYFCLVSCAILATLIARRHEFR